MSNLPPFASRSVPEHLARGAIAVGLVTLAVWLLSSPGVLNGAGAVAALIGAVVLLRGCPMCWLTGLIGTIANASRKKHQR